MTSPNQTENDSGKAWSGRFSEPVSDLVKRYTCLLYTSDAADERSSVDLGGRRIITKKKFPTPTFSSSLACVTTQVKRVYLLWLQNTVDLGTYTYSNYH